MTEDQIPSAGGPAAPKPIGDKAQLELLEALGRLDPRLARMYEGCGDHIFIRGQATRSRVACPIGFRPPMIVALAYLLLRLLLDLVDVRLRVHDPEAELLLLRHQLRVVRRQVKRPRLNAADRTIMAVLSQLVNRSALVG